VLFFAKARDCQGSPEVIAKFPTTISVDDLRKLIFEQVLSLPPISPSFQMFPALGPLESSCLLAVDQEYVHPGQVLTLKPQTEIVVIPPLSGG
jgi:molybdopterin converting factor small subunit